MRSLILLGLLAASAQKVDHAAKMQQTIGSAKIAVQDAAYDTALSKLETLGQLLGDWVAAIQQAKDDATNPVEAEVMEVPEPTIEFSVNVTHLPEKCARKSEDGSIMKVHYVGKLIKTNKAFASSFHTGSQPFRFRLGSDDVPVPAWNKGLGGMCEGERRRLLVPWELGYGVKGTKGVPPYSELQYDFELVELGGPTIQAPKGKKGKKGKKSEL